MKFNKNKFRKAIKNAIKQRKLTIRDASVQSGIPISSLSTLQRDRIPDLLTYFKGCYWTGNDPDAFIDVTAKEVREYELHKPSRMEKCKGPLGDGACDYGKLKGKPCPKCNGTGMQIIIKEGAL